MSRITRDLIEIADWLSDRSGIFDCDCGAYMESDTGAWIHDENKCAVFWQDHIDITLRKSATTIADLLAALEHIESIFLKNIDEDGFYDRAYLVEELDDYRRTWIDAIAKARGDT